MFVPTTKRHQQLIAHTPSPQPEDVHQDTPHVANDEDDVDGYLNTTGTDGFYMPPIGEPASRGQQPGHPMSCTQRLQFGGTYDQETPLDDAAGPQTNSTVIISPTTLHKAVEEQLG